MNKRLPLQPEFPLKDANGLEFQLQDWLFTDNFAMRNDLVAGRAALRDLHCSGYVDLV